MLVGRNNMEVIYEDNHVIVVNKPAGIAVQAAKEGEEDLFVAVKKFIKERDNKPGNVFLGMVHRIDRPVSGLVMFAKTSKGASRLSEQMREGKIDKKYEAVVHGEIKNKKGRLENYLTKVKHNNGYKAIVTNDRNGDRSTLEYSVLETKDNYSRLGIDLETGRFHQIRVQLSYMGHPIVGDSLYGSKEKLTDNAIKLRAVKLEFNDVIEGDRISLKVPGFFL